MYFHYNCHKCNRPLPDCIAWTTGGPVPNCSWHMTNVAPHAASGGEMKPVCNKCEPWEITNVPETN